ncbi:ABC transporter substrate-binding protein [Halococcus hamelinensis]|uniref:Peptide ABC transporter substrate-binding protein n=1 Tax=Halococcus hamelinensis 100A6 TaxID=1132509 RepID=M0M2L2_9EURY|nr:ABC transporter substrate-binding protein [Halococcus hamelinensis]EMA38640.1 peptide ABC transporter substrate-binding protein [Halococcus hamelinensis 100A6]
MVGLAGCSSGSSGGGNNSGGNGSGGSSNGSAGGTSAGSNEDTRSGKRSVGGNYIVGDQTGITTLNWLQVDDQPTANRIRLMLDFLYTVTQDKEVFPLLAKDISTQDDQTYTVTLRDNLEWGGNYGQMTAEDWIYQIKNVFQANSNWSGYTNQSYWLTADGNPIPVEKRGKLKFDIKLQDPDPSYLLRPNLQGAWCMPKKLLNQYVPNQDTEGLKKDTDVQQVGYSGNLGPYTFDHLNRESEFVATRNENYYLRDASDVPEAWKNVPYFDKYTYKVIPEQSTRLSALKSGGVTESGIAAAKVEQFQNMDGITVQQIKQPYLTMIFYNQRKNGWKPFRKQSVRRALSYAVDKKSVVENIFRGYSEVAHTFQPQWSEWYDDSQVLETGVGKRYSPEKARTKLENALSGTEYGYDGDTLTGPDGEVSLSLVITTSSDTVKTFAQYLGQAYGEIGIDVSINPVKFNTLINKYLSNSYQGNGEPKWNVSGSNGGGRDESVSPESWDMSVGVILNTYPLTPSNTSAFFEKKGTANYVGYYPEADFESLYNEASTATNEKKRQRTYAEIFGELSKEQPYNFVSMGSDIYGYQSKVQGPKNGESPYLANWDSWTWDFKPQQ